QGGRVTTITVGSSSDDPTIRKALAIGANDAVRINADPTDPFFVAKQISNYAANEKYDVVMTGKETIDYNGSQIGSMISELLDVPFVSLATKLDVDGTTATLERDVQGGLEVVEVDFPFVLSASKGMAEQRIPNMRGIMAARTKPLKVIDEIEQKALTSVIKFELPNPKTGCKYVDPENMDELVELLHNESKVI
ncbi:electron transfer flavoprotein beta subunit/FixA family protein, partial [bacterium]|nr:electron transfer flavoprotein beta subunit/FixA family protein [bacterium]